MIRLPRKLLFPALYTAAMLLVVLYVWDSQVTVRLAHSDGLFKNLMEYPAWVRRGFDPAEIRTVPDAGAPGAGGGWYRFENQPLRIIDSPLPDLPKRPFLSPFGRAEEEFTILIALEMDGAAMNALLPGGAAVIPGLYFAIIGDNWEIYLNGTLVRSEMHLDETGKIRSHRLWRDVYFPVETSLLHPGTNILAVRTIGDPAYNETGLYYNTPYYLDAYQNIERRHEPYLLVALCGIFIFTGIYHLMLFLNIRGRREKFNLHFALLSLALAAYTILRNGIVNLLIPDSNIGVRLEYTTVFLLSAFLGLFFESFDREKITVPTKMYLAFCLVLSLVQAVFCSQFGDDILVIWNLSTLIYMSYVLVYDVIYFSFKKPKNGGGGAEAGDAGKSAAISDIVVGAVAVYLCGIFDVLDVIFLHYSFSLFQYGFFLITLSIAFTLSTRFSGLYNRLGEANTTLESAVRERTAELEKQTEIAVNASHAKSAFLANMSHEIRTPMNAIVGMSELLLRGNLSEDERGYAVDIKQAGQNLISIINDILDFSKVESGKMDIITTKYLLPSLVNDVVNIIRMRLVERPIRFYTNIDAALPNGLAGDEVRVRQVLLNLLSNAAKYTGQGCISMSITESDSNGADAPAVREDEETVWLKIRVSDTGMGIKPEDQQKLFGDFVQVDAGRNKGIEGTGLGLAITKRLCEAMGGGISVESEYGKGSVFTVLVPQGVHSPEPFAVIEEPEKKKVLVYERRLSYAESVCWSLENMKVPYSLVTALDAFTEVLYREPWYYVFSGYGLYNRIKPFVEREGAAFAGGKKPPLALMVEWGAETFVPGVRFITLPVQSLSIANILNGKPDGGYMEARGGRIQTRFIIPEVSLLVVDDIASNLKVAEGLLAPYQAQVDTCLSGAEAVERVKRKPYDIVFMDHMMPGMDGIEAAARIRAWEEEHGSASQERLPIIALTANAVSGMREMFLEKGFSDFLSKPIDVSKLDEILSRWAPKEKQKKGNGKRGAGNGEEQGAVLVLPGVDVKRGIAMTGGTEKLYREVLALFRKDAEERLPLLRNFEQDPALFVTQVHALKSASASIGAAELSAEAARLEAADLPLIRSTLPAFTERLAALAANIAAALPAPEESSDPHSPIPATLLNELIQALETQNAEDIDRLLEELNQQTLDPESREIIGRIADNVLMAEYEKAAELVKELK